MVVLQGPVSESSSVVRLGLELMGVSVLLDGTGNFVSHILSREANVYCPSLISDIVGGVCRETADDDSKSLSVVVVVGGGYSAMDRMERDDVPVCSLRNGLCYYMARTKPLRTMQGSLHISIH